MIRYFVNLLFLLLCLAACNGNREKAEKKITKQTLKEPLIRLNKKHAEVENDQIKAYIKRQNWSMNESGTGLRYYIYQQGDGDTAREGLVAKVNYDLKLLDGRLCYSTKETGPQEFKIGRDDVESGLHEGICYMRVGDKAKMVIPSHLAHGLIGDQKKIPMRSTIIYDIELLALR